MTHLDEGMAAEERIRQDSQQEQVCMLSGAIDVACLGGKLEMYAMQITRTAEQRE